MSTYLASWPPVKTIPGKPTPERRWNARHNLLGIRIHEGIRHPGATLMQEFAEWRMLRLWGAPFLAMAVIVPLANKKLHPLVTLLPGLVLHTFAPRLDSLRRKMELRGHTVECLVAQRRYGYDLVELMDKEARSLTGYGQFDGWSEAKCLNAMIDEIPWATRWVKRHAGLIDKWVKRLPEDPSWQGG